MRGVTRIPIGVSRSAVDKVIDALKKETGLEYAIRMNDKDVKHKEPARKQAVPYASRQHRRNTERSAKRIARKAKKLDTLRG